jgi:predicted nucleotidyltransferase
MSGSDPYLEAWRARARAADTSAAAWRAERLLEATRAARALVEQLGARRVLLFGSVAHGSATPESDVDLWVEGLAESAFLDAVSLVRHHITATEVDLVRAEWARASVRERALEEGVVLYAR